MDLTDKNAPTTSICFNMKKELTFFPICFKKHFANLASNLVKRLPDPTGKFGIPSVHQYYKGINFYDKRNFNLKLVQCQF